LAVPSGQGVQNEDLASEKVPIIMLTILIEKEKRKMQHYKEANKINKPQ